ncbi:NUDIX hydrolase [Shimazuella kribbensis]|uniref:NUDIX hydrolase n=1 Tax=Shimazuella kribbensis TaxID=139808 RepID=UPI000411E5CA|nr:NUDIX domain-containing protein [Shimazuella kribbensis]
MEILQSFQNISWLPKPNVVSEVLSSTLPPIGKITTVFGVVTYKGKVLVAHLYRGWDLPGGHVDNGEGLMEALEREVFEETKVRIYQPTLVGYQKLEVLADKPKNYQYPYPESYQVHFHAEVKEICEFEGDSETYGRDFFSFDQVAQLPNFQHRLGLIRFVLGGETKNPHF